MDIRNHGTQTLCPTQLVRHLRPQALFLLVLGIGVLFLSLLLYLTADINLQRACITVVRRLLKTVALRQVGSRQHPNFQLLVLVLLPGNVRRFAVLSVGRQLGCHRCAQ